jgi:hypothetical protein
MEVNKDGCINEGKMIQNSKETQENNRKLFLLEPHDGLTRYSVCYSKFKLLYPSFATDDDQPNTVLTTLHDLGSVVHTLEDTFLLSGIILALKTRYAVDWVAIIEEAKDKWSIMVWDVFPVSSTIALIVCSMCVKMRTQTTVVKKREGKCNKGPTNRGLCKRRTKNTVDKNTDFIQTNDGIGLFDTEKKTN